MRAGLQKQLAAQAREQAARKREEVYERELSKLIPRTAPLGMDRFFNRYWWFYAEPRVLFVEKARADVPLVQARLQEDAKRAQAQEEQKERESTSLGPRHTLSLDLNGPAADGPAEESPESGPGTPGAGAGTLEASGAEERGEEGGEGATTAAGASTAVLCPWREESPTWGCFTTVVELDALIASLDPRGVREGQLKGALQHMYEKLSVAMRRKDGDKGKGSKGAQAKDEDGDSTDVKQDKGAEGEGGPKAGAPAPEANGSTTAERGEGAPQNDRAASAAESCKAPAQGGTPGEAHGKSVSSSVGVPGPGPKWWEKWAEESVALRGAAGGRAAGMEEAPVIHSMLTKKLHALKGQLEEAKAEMPEAWTSWAASEAAGSAGAGEKGKKEVVGRWMSENELAVLRQLLLEWEAAVWEVSEKVRAAKGQRKGGEEGGEEDEEGEGEREEAEEEEREEQVRRGRGIDEDNGTASEVEEDEEAEGLKGLSKGLSLWRSNAVRAKWREDISHSVTLSAFSYAASSLK